MDEPTTHPISLVMWFAMFGTVLTVFYINPLITLMLTTVVVAWLAVCEIWEV